MPAIQSLMPLSLSDHGIHLDGLFREREHEREHVLGHAHRIFRVRHHEGDASSGQCSDIDGIKSDPDLTNDL